MTAEPAQASPQATPPRRWGTLLIVSVAGLALGALSLLKLPAGPSLRLKTCFQDVNGLRPGAKVRLAGVDIGTVQDVRAQPADKACPGAVEMELRTPYELKIPKDSVASTDTEGVLGPTYLEIDISRASGPPIQTGGQLPGKESVKLSVELADRALRAIESLRKQLSDAEKPLSEAEKNCAQPTKPPSGARPAPKPTVSSIPK